MKKFTCGLCKKEKPYVGTRKSLRDHIQRVHIIRSQLTNKKNKLDDSKTTKQNWWLDEEIPYGK